jgi:hypothetical protein
MPYSPNHSFLLNLTKQIYTSTNNVSPNRSLNTFKKINIQLLNNHKSLHIIKFSTKSPINSLSQKSAFLLISNSQFQIIFSNILTQNPKFSLRFKTHNNSQATKHNSFITFFNQQSHSTQLSSTMQSLQTNETNNEPISVNETVPRVAFPLLCR